MFNNLKIAITDAVQLKAVCDVLESMGYRLVCVFTNTKWILTKSQGIYMGIDDSLGDAPNHFIATTLTDLLAMRDKQFKEKIGA